VFAPERIYRGSGYGHVTVNAVTATDHAVPGRFRDPLASSEFRALFGAFMVSMPGSSVAGLALTVLVYRQTTSALLSALTFTMTLVPYLFGGTLLSGLIDRMSPRRLLVSSDLVSAALVALMVLPATPLPVLFVLLFGVSVLAPLSAGSRGALLPEILPPHAVLPGRSLIRMVAQGAQIAGYAVGGGLLAVMSPRGVLAVEVCTFVASALVLRVFLSSRPARGRAAASSLAGDSLRGVREIMRNRPLCRVLLLGWLTAFLLVAPEALAAPAVAERGHPGSAAGWWLAAAPVGTVLGELAGIWLIPATWRARLTVPLIVGGFAPLMIFFLHPGIVTSLVLLGICGACGVYMLGLDQLFLDVTPPELLGRTYAVNTSGLMVTQGVGFAVAGALGEFVSPDIVITLAGAAGLVPVVVLSGPGRPRLRRPAGRTSLVAPDEGAEAGQVDVSQ
jgi:MFS family permease